MIIPAASSGLRMFRRLKPAEAERRTEALRRRSRFSGRRHRLGAAGAGARCGEPAAVLARGADLGLYVFIHPLPQVIAWPQMDADDLGRMLGWQFSLMVAAVRMINSGLLDELPTLKIQFSHFAAGLGRYLGRIRGFQQRDKWGTAAVPRHGRQPQHALRSLSRASPVLRLRRLGRAPTMRPNGAPNGCASACRRSPCRKRVFATDYPQAVRDPERGRGLCGRGARARAQCPRHGGRHRGGAPDP